MEMGRRTYLEATGIVAVGTIGLAGCSDTAVATGTLATRVTDQPGDISDFDSCVVTIQGIWVKPNGTDDGTTTETEADGTAETVDGGVPNSEDSGATETDTPDGSTGVEGDEDVDEGGRRMYHEFDESQEADLVELQDGNTQLIDERELETRQYEYLQLDVTAVDGVLAGGEEAEVATPGNAPLQFEQRFEVREDQTTTFVGDFTPVRRGRTERYLLQPVASGTRVEYEGETDA